jgi:long-chain acyl-CoA synthetase
MPDFIVEKMASMGNDQDNIGRLLEEGGLNPEYRDMPALISWSSVHSRVIETLTFAQLSFVSKRVEDALVKHGIMAGHSVAVLSHPTMDYYTTVAGILRLGAIVVNINWRQPVETMKYMTSLGRSVRVFASRKFIQSGEALELLPDTPVIMIDRADDDDFLSVKRTVERKNIVVDLLFGESTVHAVNNHNESLGKGVAAVMFTSGSTGNPKGVPLTHRGLLWSCRAKLEAHGGVDAVKRGTLSFLPNFHVMGFTNNFLFNVCVARCPAFIHADCESVALR